MRTRSYLADQVQIIKANPDHLSEILEIENEVFSTPWSSSLFVKELSSSSNHYLCAILFGEVVGYGGFRYFDQEAHITTLAVTRFVQQRGIGKMLLEKLIEDARGLGIVDIWLEVRAKNYQAINLYLSLGFMPVYVRKKYYEKPCEDALVMQLSR